MREKLARILLRPFSAIYGLGLLFRNAFYDAGIVRSTSFNIPVISIGNLSVGGAGKTPHVEYLTQLLSQYYPIGILSRGYKRKSKGFRLVNAQDKVTLVGDEPLQFKRKFQNTVVAVSESRAIGIPMLLQKHPNVGTILLDDAFQHRSVTPEINVLVTEFDFPYTQDYLLPAGRLREYRSASERADIIIISKCPSEEDKVNTELIESEINLLNHQSIFYSYYDYQDPYYLLNPRYRVKVEKPYEIILLTAIASEDYLLKYLEPKVDKIISFRYEDHHYFTEHDMSQLNLTFAKIEAPNKFIVTTEKDATRLEMHKDFIIKNKLPIFVLPIEVKFLFDEGPKFDSLIKKYLLNFSV